MGRRGSDRRTTVLAVVAAVVLTWAGITAHVLSAAEPPPPPAPLPSPSARPPLLTAAATGAPEPSAAGLQRALAAGLRDPALGGSVVLSVIDAVSGDALWESAAGQLVTPASTAKIATAVAALTALPPERRLTTRVVAGAAPGEVVIVGAGDASLAGSLTPRGYPEPARISDLAAQVRTGLGTAKVIKVVVDGSLYAGPLLGPGWRPQYVTSGDVAPVMALMVDGGRTTKRPSSAPRLADPALAAGRQLARLLGAPTAPVARGRAAAGARELGAVSSPTVAELVEAMLTNSDNDLAEALVRQVALMRGQSASFAGASAAVGAVLQGVLAQVGAPPGSVRLQDGSGLSRLDRLQPAALTRLLAAVAGSDRARLAPVLSGLPVAGFDGTLDDRFRAGPAATAAGVVRAKTGTLNGVGALAGLVRTRDGRLLAFALAADAVPIGGTRAAQAALDRLAAALAGCGCP